MKNSMKPKMAMKTTKVVVKPAGKMPAKVAVKTTKAVVQPKPKMIAKSPVMQDKIKKAFQAAKKGIKTAVRDLSGSGYGTL